MPTATHRQVLRLTTLALTRDITGGRRVTLRSERKAILARLLDKKLSEDKAARIIARWEASEPIPLELEKSPEYLGVYVAQPKILGWTLYKLCTV